MSIVRSALPLAALPLVLLAPPQDDERLAKRFDQLLERTQEMHQTRGISVRLTVGGDVLYARGVGSTHAFVETRKVTEDSVWPAASWIEQLTVALALRLANAGELDLDDPVGKYLEGMEWEDHEVTLRHLAMHTSGLTAYDALPARPVEAGGDEVPDPVERLRGEALDTTPGTCLTYSPSNALLLGRIIEKVTDKLLAEAIAESLFAPLELDGASFEDGLGDHLGVAAVTQAVAGWREEDGLGAVRFGAGDLAARPNDVETFVRGLADGLVIGEEGTRTLFGDQRLNDGTLVGYGFGWNRVELADVRGYSFGGSIEEQHMHAAYYPELDAVLVAFADCAADPELEAFERTLVRVAFGMRTGEMLDFELSEDELAVYTGTYQIACNHVRVASEDGQLTFTGVDRPSLTLAYQGRDLFVAREDTDTRLSFFVEADKAVGFVLEERGTRTSARRID
ncbi:MAG: beta-lactamase family protein [bacterium]|nr:beta-lactamase family protein [bacterium]